MWSRRAAGIIVGAFALALGVASAGVLPPPTLNGEIRPLLRAHCVPCHTGANPAAGLDLTSGDGWKRVVAISDPDGSVLMKRLLGQGGLPQMPRGFRALSPEQIELVRRWIGAGAPVGVAPKRHWAYVAPALQPVPSLKSPFVKNPIDAFVLANLQAKGLHPSKEASRETLIRRLSLDLIGLPPSPSEVATFAADSAPNAYERLVDRLLANPHFGERQARWWLDLARYADSNGYEADRARTMWLYRDWVIDAFNRNMPFDRFTVEQLAGDLLPNPTVSQLIATGFNRNTMFNEEGGVDADEAMYETIIDRVSTTSEVWLGQTLQCARCHDHKYDPFSQRDFFRLYAFFNNNLYEARGDAKVGQKRYFEPEITVSAGPQSQRLRNLASDEAALRAKLARVKPELDKAEADWLKSWNSPRTWLAPAAIDLTSEPPVAFERLPDDSIRAVGANPANPTYTVRMVLPSGRFGAVRLEALPDTSFANGGSGRSTSGNIVLSKVLCEVDGEPVPLELRAADYIQPGYSLDGLADEDGESGWALSPRQNEPHSIVMEPRAGIAGKQLVLKLQFGSREWPQHSLGRFRIRVTDEPGAALQLAPPDVQLALGKAERSQTDKRLIDQWYQSLSPVSFELAQDLRRIVDERRRVSAQLPTALIMRDRKGVSVLTAPVRHRGEFLSPEGAVTASTPSVLPPLPPGRADRLALAKWLVSAQNPLTARVQVNRVWEQFFGRGIVETSENFGTQGSRPSNPALLDWLAIEYQRLKWDTKALMKLIVCSSTYRQSSASSSALQKLDPNNVLLARGPRFRLDAEAIRDVALACSGLLSGKIGGPSVFPSQPSGIWNSPYNGERWIPSSGQDSHRRALYTYWKRTAPYPAFSALDAMTRESCVIRRIRTNTPLQALALLNDPAMVEAAAALGKRARREGGADPIGYAFQLATSRNPSAQERAQMAKLLASAKARFATQRSNLSAAERAWTLLCNVLLNLDETITKG